MGFSLPVSERIAAVRVSIFRNVSGVMASGDYYRAKAAELEAQAGARTDPVVRQQLTVLARGYARLGDQADLNNDATMPATGSPESGDARK